MEDKKPIVNPNYLAGGSSNGGGSGNSSIHNESTASNDGPPSEGRVPEVDCTNAARGVWLVKVPKYIASRWQTLAPGKEVGKLKISNFRTKQQEIKFDLSNELLASKPADAAEAKKLSSDFPREHQFQISDISHQTLAVVSQNSAKKLAIEGNVVQKGECRPMGGRNYMALKSEAMKNARIPVRTVQTLESTPITFKPISAHKADVEFEQKRKAEGKKSRDDKDKVQDVLFGAFEKHQYYNIKDLERLTRQPVPYLKEILKEICVYNAKNPHKNMWELKPEYRHYKNPAAPKEGSS